jgi:hypothetical protein
MLHDHPLMYAVSEITTEGTGPGRYGDSGGGGTG